MFRAPAAGRLPVGLVKGEPETKLARQNNGLIIET